MLDTAMPIPVMSELLRYMVVLIHPANSSASKSAILYILAV